MTILVVGASGLAGRHVAGAIAAHGLRVLRTARAPRDGDAIALDLLDPRSIDALPPFDVVVNCAGLTPARVGHAWADYRAVNVDAVDRLARAARERRALFIQVSTMARLSGAVRTRHRRSYVLSKKLAERCLRSHVQAGLDVWIVRTAAMYGEGDRGNMSRLIRAIAHRRFAFAGGTQRKCFLYAGTLGDAVVAHISGPREGTPPVEYLSSGEALPFSELVGLIERLTDGRAWRVPLSIQVAQGIAGSVGHAAHVLGLRRLEDTTAAALVSFADVQCAEPNAIARLGVEPLPIAEGIRRQVGWMREHGAL